MFTDGKPSHRVRAIREALMLHGTTDIQLIVIGNYHNMSKPILCLTAYFFRWDIKQQTTPKKDF